MAKKAQTGKDKKAAQKAAEAKGETVITAGSGEKGTSIVAINKKALSLDVGPKVVAMFDTAARDHEKALAVLDQVKVSRYNGISMMTLAILKAAENDPNINLADSFSGDKKLMGKLNDQIGIAVGLREVATIIDGAETYQRVVPAKAVAQYFPGPDDKKVEGVYVTPEAQKKDTLRGNIATLLKSAAQSAEGIRVNKLKAEMDKTAGTLRLTGPALKSQFDSNTVLLNESTKQGGEGKELSSKPSFTAIRNMGAVMHDAATIGGKSNTRGQAAGAATTAKKVSPDEAFQTMVTQVIMALGKFTGPLEGKTKDSAASLKNALDAKLNEK